MVKRGECNKDRSSVQYTAVTIRFQNHQGGIAGESIMVISVKSSWCNLHSKISFCKTLASQTKQINISEIQHSTVYHPNSMDRSRTKGHQMSPIVKSSRREQASPVVWDRPIENSHVRADVSHGTAYVSHAADAMGKWISGLSINTSLPPRRDSSDYLQSSDYRT